MYTNSSNSSKTSKDKNVYVYLYIKNMYGCIFKRDGCVVLLPLLTLLPLAPAEAQATLRLY